MPLMQALRAGDPRALGAALHNDLQTAALELDPGLAEPLAVAQDAGALGVVVSGLRPDGRRPRPQPAARAGARRRVHGRRRGRRVLTASGPVAGARVVSTAADRAVDPLSRPPDARIAVSAARRVRREATMAHLLGADRVTLTLGTRTLLDGVSLGLDDGERIGVVGPNGAGKSTLLRVLSGLQEPDDGRVTRAGGLRVAVLDQRDDLLAGQHRPRRRARRPPTSTSGRPTPASASVHAGLLADVDARRRRRHPVRRPAPPGRARRAAGPRRRGAASSTSPPTTSTSRASRGWPRTWSTRYARGQRRARRRHPRPLVPRRGLHAHVGGARRRPSTSTRAGTPPTCWRGPSGPGTAVDHRGEAAEPAAQGARLAAPRRAGAHVQAEVPDRRRRPR